MWTSIDCPICRGVVYSVSFPSLDELRATSYRDDPYEYRILYRNCEECYGTGKVWTPTVGDEVEWIATIILEPSGIGST